MLVDTNEAIFSIQSSIILKSQGCLSEHICMFYQLPNGIYSRVKHDKLIEIYLKMYQLSRE